MLPRPASNDPAFLHSRSRLNACAFTLGQTLNDLEDPGDPDLRADLLLAAEDALNAALALHAEISRIVWHDLDVAAHPAGNGKRHSKEYEDD